MDRATTPTMPTTRPAGRRSLLRSGLLFVGIGLALYAALLVASERLLYRTGDSNPFFKIETLAGPQVDWVILGASHAMPLDFADLEEGMEAATERSILNLASPGTGPLYNRFVLERFLEGHRTGNILYAADSFAFRHEDWNEKRFADSKLLARTPFSPGLARRLLGYVVSEGVDPRAFLSYATGFAKINNRDRFEPDVWEGEATFDRSFRPSPAAEATRIEYLYPEGSSDAAPLARYLREFERLLDLAARHGIEVTIVKMPVPPRFASSLPDEETFDAAISRVAAEHGAAFHDFSAAVPDPSLYFDTDHLNRRGLETFFDAELKPLLSQAPD